MIIMIIIMIMIIKMIIMITIKIIVIVEKEEGEEEHVEGFNNGVGPTNESAFRERVMPISTLFQHGF